MQLWTTSTSKGVGILAHARPSMESSSGCLPEVYAYLIYASVICWIELCCQFDG